MNEFLVSWFLIGFAIAYITRLIHRKPIPLPVWILYICFGPVLVVGIGLFYLLVAIGEVKI